MAETKEYKDEMLTKGCPWVFNPELTAVPLRGWRTERPVINQAKCHQCGVCYLYCPTSAIEETEKGFVIEMDFCKGCGICAYECPNQAIAMGKERG